MSARKNKSLPKNQVAVEQSLNTAGRSPSHKSGAPCSRLLRWNELEDWQRDNHFIETGYRPASHSILTSLGSLTYLHNETCNIHTHLLGALLHIYHLYENPHPALLPFHLTAITCLTTSAAFHALSNHSPHLCSRLNAADHACIVLLIWGSFIPALNYGFACDTHLRDAYIALITAIGLGCLAMTFQKRFRTPAWRPVRSAMFVGMGLSAVAPVVHGLLKDGLDELRKRMSLGWLVLQGAVYVAGAGVYAARVPERWGGKGRWDLVGASHQIFHVAVVVAAGCHLRGLLLAKENFERWGCTE